MGCIYLDTSWDTEDSGKCSLWDEDIEMNGCDKDGYCRCSEDPDPNVLCDTYESDMMCIDCGADMNIEECTCDE